MDKNEKAKQIGILASVEEVLNLELIMKVHGRNSYSDAIRFLITQEAQKILSKNTTIGVNNN